MRKDRLVLWGSLAGRQYGGPRDRRLLRVEEAERAAFLRLGAQMNRAFSRTAMGATEAGRQLGEGLSRAFAPRRP